MNDINVIALIVPLLLAAVGCIILAALFIGILGIRKAPSRSGKTGVLFSMLICAGCGSAVFFALGWYHKRELREALRQAALADNSAKAKTLVARGAPINKQDMDGYTMLRNAIERGDWQSFRTLVEAGADVNARWPNRGGNGTQTPLELVLDRSYYSEREGFDYPAVKLLLEHGARFNFTAADGRRQTCLQQTIQKGHVEILKLMLENGAELSIRDNVYQGGALHWAAGNREILELLLTYHPDVNTSDGNGHTPLHLAAQRSGTDCASILIENGADVNVRDRNGDTPLHLAVSRGYMGTAEVLIQNGADVNAEDNSKWTPLQYALERNYSLPGDEIHSDVKRLLDHGAKFNFKVRYQGKTCLQNAVESSKIELLKVMLENGADIHTPNPEGGVLHWAAGKKTSIAVLEFLLSQHPDVNMKDGYGNTPLHRAAACGRDDMVSLLIENGADINARNNRNMTAVEWAQSLRNPPRGPEEPRSKSTGAGIMMLRGSKNESR